MDSTSSFAGQGIECSVVYQLLNRITAGGNVVHSKVFEYIRAFAEECFDRNPAPSTYWHCYRILGYALAVLPPDASSVPELSGLFTFVCCQINSYVPEELYCLGIALLSLEKALASAGQHDNSNSILGTNPISNSHSAAEVKDSHMIAGDAVLSLPFAHVANLGPPKFGILIKNLKSISNLFMAWLGTLSRLISTQSNVHPQCWQLAVSYFCEEIPRVVSHQEGLGVGVCIAVGSLLENLLLSHCLDGRVVSELLLTSRYSLVALAQRLSAKNKSSNSISSNNNSISDQNKDCITLFRSVTSLLLFAVRYANFPGVLSNIFSTSIVVLEELIPKISNWSGTCSGNGCLGGSNFSEYIPDIDADSFGDGNKSSINYIVVSLQLLHACLSNCNPEVPDFAINLQEISIDWLLQFNVNDSAWVFIEPCIELIMRRKLYDEMNHRPEGCETNESLRDIRGRLLVRKYNAEDAISYSKWCSEHLILSNCWDNMKLDEGATSLIHDKIPSRKVDESNNVSKSKRKLDGTSLASNPRFFVSAFLSEDSQQLGSDDEVQLNENRKVTSLAVDSSNYARRDKKSRNTIDGTQFRDVVNGTIDDGADERNFHFSQDQSVGYAPSFYSEIRCVVQSVFDSSISLLRKLQTIINDRNICNLSTTGSNKSKPEDRLIPGRLQTVVPSDIPSKLDSSVIAGEFLANIRLLSWAISHCRTMTNYNEDDSINSSSTQDHVQGRNFSLWRRCFASTAVEHPHYGPSNHSGHSYLSITSTLISHLGNPNSLSLIDLLIMLVIMFKYLCGGTGNDFFTKEDSLVVFSSISDVMHNFIINQRCPATFIKFALGPFRDLLNDFLSSYVTKLTMLLSNSVSSGGEHYTDSIFKILCCPSDQIFVFSNVENPKLSFPFLELAVSNSNFSVLENFGPRIMQQLSVLFDDMFADFLSDVRAIQITSSTILGRHGINFLILRFKSVLSQFFSLITSSSPNPDAYLKSCYAELFISINDAISSMLLLSYASEMMAISWIVRGRDSSGSDKFDEASKCLMEVVELCETSDGELSRAVVSDLVGQNVGNSVQKDTMSPAENSCSSSYVSHSNNSQRPNNSTASDIRGCCNFGSIKVKKTFTKSFIQNNRPLVVALIQLCEQIRVHSMMNRMTCTTPLPVDISSSHCESNSDTSLPKDDRALTKQLVEFTFNIVKVLDVLANVYIKRFMEIDSHDSSTLPKKVETPNFHVISSIRGLFSVIHVCCAEGGSCNGEALGKSPSFSNAFKRYEAIRQSIDSILTNKILCNICMYSIGGDLVIFYLLDVSSHSFIDGNGGLHTFVKKTKDFINFKYSSSSKCQNPSRNYAKLLSCYVRFINLSSIWNLDIVLAGLGELCVNYLSFCLYTQYLKTQQLIDLASVSYDISVDIACELRPMLIDKSFFYAIYNNQNSAEDFFMKIFTHDGSARTLCVSDEVLSAHFIDISATFSSDFLSAGLNELSSYIFHSKIEVSSNGEIIMNKFLEGLGGRGMDDAESENNDPLTMPILIKLYNALILTLTLSPRLANNVPSSLTIQRMQNSFRINSQWNVFKEPCDAYFIFGLLMSEAIQRHSISDLIDCELLKKLKDISAYLQLTNFTSKDGSRDANGNFTVSELLLNRVLYLLVWHLGSTDSIQMEYAKKGMMIWGFIYHTKQWNVPQKGKRKSADAFKAEMDANISTLIADNYFRIDSRVFPNQWKKEGSHLGRAHLMRVLRQLVLLMRQEDLVNYLPKIMATVNKATSTSAPVVVLAAIDLLVELAKKICPLTLEEYFVSISASIFSILENYSSAEFISASIKDDVSEQGINRVYMTDYKPHNLLPDDSGRYYNNVTTMVAELSDSSFLFQINSRLITLINSRAHEVVKILFTDRQSITHRLIEKVAYVPADIPALDNIRNLHVKRFQKFSLEESLTLLCGMMRHESLQVRKKALDKITTLVRDRRDDLQPKYRDGGAEISLDRAENQKIVVFLLKELFDLCSYELDRNVLIACGRCFGAIGAIDPARVPIVGSIARDTGNKESGGVSTPSSTAAGSKSSNNNNVKNLAPWKSNVEETAMHILEHYLAPSLKSSISVTSHNSVAYSIQEILKILARENDATINIDSLPDQFPSNLHRKLLDKKLFDLCEGFWKTRYVYSFKLESFTRFYRPGIKFEDWISSFVKYLIGVSTNRLGDVYRACQVVITKRWDLGLFLFPRVVLDALVVDYQNSLSKVATKKRGNLTDSDKEDKSVFDVIVNEICSVLSSNTSGGGVGSSGQSSEADDSLGVQSVFSLLDTLRQWMVDINLDARKRIAHMARAPGLALVRPSSIQVIPSSILSTVYIFEDSNYNFYSHAAVVIQKLLNSIPNGLLIDAANRKKAYARALRYLEIETRSRNIEDIHATMRAGASTRSGKSSNSLNAATNAQMGNVIAFESKRNDGSNGALPSLTAAQLDQLTDLFSKLEDYDSTHGISILKQAMGYTLTPWDRIKELEQTDDWLSALLEYGNLYNQEGFDNSSNFNSGMCNQVLNGNRLSDITPNHKYPSGLYSNATGNANSVVNSQRFFRSPSMMPTSKIGGGIGDWGSKDLALAGVKIERQKLRCMIELGHADAVLDQIGGICQRYPDMESLFLPIGVEASWRLSDWGALDEYLGKSANPYGDSATSNIPTDSTLSRNGNLREAMNIKLQNGASLQRFENIFSAEDTFQINIGRALLQMKLGDKVGLSNTLDDIRLTTMHLLPAAAMESYARSYPLLVRLHVAEELDLCSKLMDIHGLTTEDTISKRSAYVKSMGLPSRCEALTPSIRQRSVVLAAHRSIYSCYGMQSLMAEHWLAICDSMCTLKKFDSAMLSLRQARGIDPHVTLMRECKILKGQGYVGKALMLLEPVEFDVESAAFKARLAAIKASSSDSRQSLFNFAEKLQLATEIMVENRQKLSHVIINRYKTVLKLRENWDQAHFEFGKYYEYLFEESKNNGTSGSGNGGNRSKNSNSMDVSKGISSSSRAFDNNSFGNARHLHHAIEQFSKCIQSSSKFVQEALPRMLTLWTTFTAIRDPNSPGASALGASPPSVKSLGGGAARPGATTGRPSSGNGSSGSSGNSSRLSSSSSRSSGGGADSKLNLLDCQDHINELMQGYVTKIPASVWYLGLPQLVSRTGHRNLETLKVVVDIIRRVTFHFPHQSVWHIAGLLDSFNESRKLTGQRMFGEVKNELRQSNRGADATMMDDAHRLFGNLRDLATYIPPEQNARKIKSNLLSKIANPQNIVIPTQNILASTGSDNFGSDKNPSRMTILSINEQVDVAASKARPKTISIITTCGKVVKFLVKQEKNGDLRKDARMMEVCYVINRLLSGNFEGRSRKLCLRTFAVACLNEECGVLEWVNNTSCLRPLIAESNLYFPEGVQQNNVSNFKEIFPVFDEMQKKNDSNIDDLVKSYRQLITSQYKPCFHRWFLEQYPDAMQWYTARETFTRSAAVWSAVGHVIGLGDRHIENILIDLANGECVHVDFDCLFDKGLGLKLPEIVPFRLTPNMIDAMGVSGVEGCFRNVMEVVLLVLREHKDMVISVLEPFLRDPTVAWGRSGRAQRSDDASDSRDSTHRNAEPNQENENTEATEMLGKIRGRLMGVYNIVHPHFQRFLNSQQTQSGNSQRPRRGLGAALEEGLPLSVSGQVERLIDEATCDENLAQMYIGWQPWV